MSVGFYLCYVCGFSTQSGLYEMTFVMHFTAIMSHILKFRTFKRKEKNDSRAVTAFSVMLLCIEMKSCVSLHVYL